jgi:uncharacterized protein YeaO (DUF488 family)
MPAKPVVSIKRVYEPPAASDGARVLVDRIWPRGMTKEQAQLALWARDVAPSTPLRKWFGHDPALWDEFQRRYREELKSAPLDDIRRLIAEGPVTLVYSAHDEAHNQAVVIADYLSNPD